MRPLNNNYRPARPQLSGVPTHFVQQPVGIIFMLLLSLLIKFVCIVIFVVNFGNISFVCNRHALHTNLIYPTRSGVMNFTFFRG